MTNTKTKSSKSYGRSECVNAVWNKASKVQGKSPTLYRRDSYGQVLYKPSYGKDTNMGWNVDHIKPKSKGGSYGLRNLQALQTSKNKSLGNSTIKRKI